MPWFLGKQSAKPTVSTSTMEGEYRVLAMATEEVLWISYILDDLGVLVVMPIDLFCDNKCTLLIAQNLCLHGRTKHIDIDVHFVRDHISSGFLGLCMFPLYHNLLEF